MSPANECIPFYEDAERFTGSVLAGQAVTGKRFVDVAGDIQGAGSPGLTVDTAGGNIQIRTATAAGLTIGVASHDAASLQKVTVIGGGHIVPVTAVGAIAAGAEVEVGANGRAATHAAGRAVGRAYADAADGEDAMIKLYES